MKTDLQVIKILKGSTRVQVVIHPQSPYLMPIRDLLKRKLCDYVQDPRTKIWSVGYRYYTYNKSTYTLSVPVNALQLITDELTAYSAPFTIEDEKIIDGRKINIKMIDSFTPREAQIPIIDIMSNDVQRMGISTATGSGKTISTLASIVKRSKCAMVVVSGLTDQWVRQARAFTNVGERVVLIQGISSLMKLMESEQKPDIIVFSLETLRRYVNGEENYKDLPPYEKFINYFGVDMKVFDECHMNFHAQLMIDLHSSIAKNIYLTATFVVSNPQTRRIFNMVYPDAMIHGADVRDKYIRFWSYKYRMFIPDKVYLTQRGYSHKGIEKYLYKRPTKLQHFFETVLYPLLNSHYINKYNGKEKCLVYFETINMVLAAKQWIANTYTDRRVGVYIGESEDQAYNNFEIVVTTPKKSGVGTDIKNLYVVINTVSFKAEGLAIQLPGRLRKLPDGTTPDYIEIVNTAIAPQIYHLNERERIHRQIALEYKSCNLP